MTGILMGRQRCLDSLDQIHAVSWELGRGASEGTPAALVCRIRVPAFRRGRGRAQFSSDPRPTPIRCESSSGPSTDRHPCSMARHAAGGEGGAQQSRRELNAGVVAVETVESGLENRGWRSCPTAACGDERPAYRGDAAGVRSPLAGGPEVERGQRRPARRSVDPRVRRNGLSTCPTPSRGRMAPPAPRWPGGA